MVDIERSAPVFAVRSLEVTPDDFDRLYGEVASFMSGPGAALPGVIETQLFGRLDRTRLMIVAHFRSYTDWVQAQWDARLGELLEELVTNAKMVEFDLYRSDRFLSDALPARALARRKAAS